MLKIVFGDIENSIYHPPTYFDNTYEDEWITYNSFYQLYTVNEQNIADKAETSGSQPVFTGIL